MSKSPTKSRRGAVATGASAAGATATGAASLGAMAIGAAAIGAIAVGALAIGRLTIGRARLRRVEIGQLTVGRLDVGMLGKPGDLTAVTRIRTLPGKGDAFERLLLRWPAGSGPATPFHQAHRSQSDPDLFAIYASYADEAAFERDALAQSIGALLKQAADQGLVAIPAGDPVEVDLYRAI